MLRDCRAFYCWLKKEAHTSVHGKINAHQALYCLQRMSWPKPTSDQNTTPAQLLRVITVEPR